MNTETDYFQLGVLDEQRRDRLLEQLILIHKEPRYDIPEQLIKKTKKRK